MNIFSRGGACRKSEAESCALDENDKTDAIAADSWPYSVPQSGPRSYRRCRSARLRSCRIGGYGPAHDRSAVGGVGSCEFASALSLCEHVNGPDRPAVKGRSTSRSPRCIFASPENRRLHSRARAGHEHLYFRQRRTVRASQREVVHASGRSGDSRRSGDLLHESHHRRGRRFNARWASYLVLCPWSGSRTVLGDSLAAAAGRERRTAKRIAHRRDLMSYGNLPSRVESGISAIDVPLGCRARFPPVDTRYFAM